MRHLRMVGLSLVAVLAIAAITASSASALPEWGKCTKIGEKGGKYTDSNCTVKAKKNKAKEFLGEYEWTKGAELANVPFSGKNVGSGGVLTSGFNSCEGGTYDLQRVPDGKCVEGGGTVLLSEGYLTVECETEKNTGEASGKNSVTNIAVTFTGCKLFGSIPCTGAGLETGEVKVNPLKGKLGYIKKSKIPAEKEVGVLLEPVAKHGAFAEFDCVIAKTVVGVGNAKDGAFYTPEKTGGYDGIISPITPINEMTSTYEQVYTVNYEFPVQNIPSKFEGKHIELLEDYLLNPEGGSTKWSPAGEEITNVNTATEAGEIKA